jgi:putative addiction module killer protein
MVDDPSRVSYSSHAVEVLQTPTFSRWADGLKDRQGAARIQARIRLLAMGHQGDVKPLGGGIGELRIHSRPGYRVYFTQRREQLVILLCGGDKSSQQGDIRKARRLKESIDGNEGKKGKGR